MALEDQFSRKHTYLRIAVTDRCNLRCVYCMPNEIAEWKQRDEILTLEEILRIARLLVNIGVTKIRLTGGEPLVRSNLKWLVRELARLPGLDTLALTTNGTLFAQHAPELRASGLQRLNISLDTLRADCYKTISGRDTLSDALAGIEAAQQAGFDNIKLNVVIMRGLNDDEAKDFVEFVRDRPVHVRFIEFMPFPGNAWTKTRMIPWREMMQRLREKYDLLPLDNPSVGIARGFAIEGHRGTISFISPLSDEFCSECNRLRLTADGSLKSCLLYPAEVSLRDAMRAGATDTELLQVIDNALQRKHFSHPPVEELLQIENRCMSAIGG